MRKREKDLFHKAASLEYENEILFGKSNSMDNRFHNYGKRLEELNKQIDELNAILRIKDQEMIEMTNEIHNLKMTREAMRKELMFRKQRFD
jgi:peptidoglycan hydrolase CwlO-like protein